MLQSEDKQDTACKYHWVLLAGKLVHFTVRYLSNFIEFPFNGDVTESLTFETGV